MAFPKEIVKDFLFSSTSIHNYRKEIIYENFVI
jgi:hypothetical protein